MKTRTIVLIVAIVGALLFVPRIIAAIGKRTVVAPPEQPPAPQTVPPPKKKKTILGRVVGGITEIAASLPGQYGGKVASIGGAIGQFTH